MLDLGTVRPGSTIRIPFSSFDKDDGSSITMTNYAVGDILAYKDGSTTERASTAGYTATTDFDSKTGKHLAIIDLADNTTAGFWAAGSEYLIAIDAVTVDAVTTGGWIARFRIGYPGAWFDTTIATLSSQTSFTLTTGPAEDDALNGHKVIIHDVASAVQCGFAVISDYTGSTKTVTLVAGTTFTAAASDNVSIMDQVPLQPTVQGRTLDVSSGGEAGLDWANIGSPTTAQNLSATNIDVDQVVASVSGAVGSVTGNVGGNVTGSVGSVAAGGITAASIATGAVDADALASDAVAEIADGVWDEDATGHQTQGTFGQAIGDPGADTDTIYSLVTAIEVDTTAIEVDTQDIQSRLPAALTADGNIKADTLRVGGTLQTAGDIIGDTNDIQTRLPAALVGGRIDATVDGTGMESGAVDAIWAKTIEGAFDAVESLRLANSANAGKLSGAATTTVVIRDVSDTKDRITATVDADGNRTAVTLDVA